MRYMYYHKHPRNVANECSMLKVSTKQQAQELEAAGYSRLTRQQALRHIAWVNSENDAWGSNRAFGPMHLHEVPSYTEWVALHS